MIGYYAGIETVLMGDYNDGWVGAIVKDKPCQPKMDARGTTICELETDGCIVKHKVWRMWGAQIKSTPWEGTR